MDINEAIRAAADYVTRAGGALLAESNELENRYDCMPEWACKRQSEITLEMGRIAKIGKAFRAHLDEVARV